jgi:hypothetical protein
MVEFRPFEGKLEGNAAPAKRSYRPFDERGCEIDARCECQFFGCCYPLVFTPSSRKMIV